MNYFLIFFIFLIGTSIGSFLNVLIDRLPQDKKITGRSICDYCHHKLSWYDLIPILSFFLLKGRCRYCRKKISWQYPLIEILTGSMFVFVFVFLQIKDNQYQITNLRYWLLVISYWGLISCFMVIFFSDVKYHLISDYILWALFGFSIMLKLFIYLENFFILNLVQNLIGEIPKQVWYDILSMLIVAFPIWLIYFLSKERAMGLGDDYLSAILGFLLGWQKGFLALYLAFILGGIVGLFLILFRQKKLKSKIAFGPFLVIGALVMLFWGEIILNWLIKIYRL